jgi:anti-anti-sigma regulatory factor
VHLLKTHQFSHVVVDLGSVRVVGSVVLDAIAGFCRSARGGAALCAASPDLLEILNTMKFPTIWPYYSSLPEALQNVASARTAQPAADSSRNPA